MAMSSSEERKNRTDLLFNIGLFLSLAGAWLVLFFTYFRTAADFTQFYLISHIPFREIYDQQVMHQYGRGLLAPLGITYYPPYVRPAAGSLFVKPLSLFTYWRAFAVFAGVQLAACISILWLSVKRLGVRPSALAAAAFFYPVLMGIVTGQDILAITLIAVVGLILLRDGDPLLAGLVLGCTTYKYNLFLFVPALLIVRKSWRALSGWTISALTIGLVSIGLAPIGPYIELLRSISRYTLGFSPGDMISLRGPFWSTGLPIYPGLAVLVILAALYAMPRMRLEPAFYTGQLAAILAGYHVNWYDAAVLLPLLLWLIAPSHRAKPTLGLMCGAAAAAILLLGMPLWPFASSAVVALIAIIFVTLCGMASKSPSFAPEDIYSSSFLPKQDYLMASGEASKMTTPERSEWYQYKQ